MENLDSEAGVPSPHLRHYHHHLSHSHFKSHHHNHLSLIILLLVISFILLFAAVFLLILLLRRRKFAENNESNNDNKPCDFHSIITFDSASPDVKNRCLYGGSSGRSRFRGVQVFTYKELELATDGFNEANVIRNGRFGSVYKGILSDGSVAAVKMLNSEDGIIKQGERAFRIEVDLLSRLHSPYLVELLGYCADQHHRLLIFEYMPNGSLQQHLHPITKKHQPLNWGARLRIALDCARALEFLHENSVPPVIHRDFKSNNIILDHNFRAKVSDLGLAKMGSSHKINGHISTRPLLGTSGYLAPEYVSTGELTTKSDVYSYGVVLLELLTGRIPVDTKRPPEEHVLVSWSLPRLTNREKVVEMVDPDLQGQYSKKELIQVAAIAAVCVQHEADYRPFITDVVQSLIPLVKSFSTSTSSRFPNQTPSPKS
ncbi:hypothetical protein GIB67_010692 [Kingdonia uniflora]|uniref:Protein kinase domain-containing protein n=1 Tax=Kingdonia uniflora TaxID=39325 RepID=A0A7J7L8K4_9MAGN|nr:hypothetical protein GIB67_010692 [Kingdonia uniflora]